MTVDFIQFSRLKPYAGKTTRSFELLIYQLMVNEYGHLGKFTPIDGSGGDGGIEFFLELKTGGVRGWQCKYYEDEGRLNTSNRKTAIQNSLTRAVQNYGELVEWTLCLKTNLTPGITDSKKVYRKGEQDWFRDELPTVIPAGKSLSLTFLGEDDILRLLGKPVNHGLRYYFFGNMEVNQEWFRAHCQTALDRNREKYDPELHTLSDYNQSTISAALMSPDYETLLNRLFLEIPKTEVTIQADIHEFRHKPLYNDADQAIRNIAADYFEGFAQIIEAKYDWFTAVTDSLADCDIVTFNRLVTTENENNQAIGYLRQKPEIEIDESSPLYKQIEAIYRSIHQFLELYDRVTRNYFHATKNYLVFLGDPAQGKTHLACDIVYRRLGQQLPVVFFNADRFSHESNLNEALLKLLDIPGTYGIDDLLVTFEAYGMVQKAKVAIVIDGLNETVFGHSFSPIWRNHLAALVAKIKSLQYVTLIVTCRESYKELIWNDNDRFDFHFVDGFRNEELAEAVRKYFNKYRLKADLTFANLSRFEQPIFLRIFCEIKNPEFRNSREVEVNIESDSNNDLFSLYFGTINSRLLFTSHLLRPKEPFIQNSMTLLARYMWDNDCREIPIDIFFQLIDGNRPYVKGESRAELLIDEALVLTKDIRGTVEFITITYEVIAGYLIAKYLLEEADPAFFQPHGPFHQKTTHDEQPHPLYDSITQELSLLMPQLKGKYLHDIYDPYDDQQLHFISICALWQLQPEFVREIDLEYVRTYFTLHDEARNRMFRLFRITLTDETHPLNSRFLSGLLHLLSVKERDLTWSEHIRWHAYDLQALLRELLAECANKAMPLPAERRLHLMIYYVQWFLTSTNRRLRDLATKALYHYGRRFPPELFKLTLAALPVNDPYVWERMLAASYGIALAHQQPERDAAFYREQLVPFAVKLYQAIFEDDSPFYTSHIVARDYAARTIQLALQYSPELTLIIDVNAITAPFYQSSKLDFPVMEGAEKLFDRPVRMDFSNYSLGYIVKDGHSYSNPPEKIKVRGQLYHRIYALGWNQDDFAGTDKSIEEQEYEERTRRRVVERYGKKYSWIAYREIAGYRLDLGLLEKPDIERVRTEADIDPSFPEESASVFYPVGDLLGDRNVPLLDWLKQDAVPALQQHLSINDGGHTWVCMDGYISQSDEYANRSCFSFIRGLLVKTAEAGEAETFLNKQRLGGRWLPEIRQNYYVYHGELYLPDNGLWENWDELSFELSRKKKRVKKGEPGYHPLVKVIQKGNKLTIRTTEPTSMIVDDVITRRFDVLMPVMQFTWSENQLVDGPIHENLISAEIARSLNLQPAKQGFDLCDSDGQAVTRYIHQASEDKNTVRLAYLRKDMLDRYLRENRLSLIWSVWGEREPYVSGFGIETFRQKHGIDTFFEFQQIISYSG